MTEFVQTPLGATLWITAGTLLFGAVWVIFEAVIDHINARYNKDTSQ